MRTDNKQQADANLMQGIIFKMHNIQAPDEESFKKSIQSPNSFDRSYQVKMVTDILCATKLQGESF